MNVRSFLTTSSAALGSLGLQKYLAAAESSRLVSPFGPLVTDPKGILDLPNNFTSHIISQSGTKMSDGLKVPGMPDGMACSTRALKPEPPSSSICRETDSPSPSPAPDKTVPKPTSSL